MTDQDRARVLHIMCSSPRGVLDLGEELWKGILKEIVEDLSFENKVIMIIFYVFEKSFFYLYFFFYSFHSTVL